MKKTKLLFIALFFATILTFIGLSYKVNAASGPYTRLDSTITNAEKVERDLAAINVASRAIASFPVTTSSIYGSTITWTTSDATVLNCAFVEECGWIEVLRNLEENKTATLTVTVTNGDAHDSKSFEISVPKGTTRTKQFSVTYESQFVDVQAPQNTLFGAGKNVTLASVSKEGYIFRGWYNNPEGTGRRYTTTLGMIADTTLYAKFERIVLTDIELTTYPSKREYTALESFDSTGLVVTGKYSDNSTQIIPNSSLTFDKTTLSGTDTSVSVSYGGITKSIPVTVNKIILSGVTYENQIVTYDGKSHNIAITGTLPEWLTVSYADAQTNASTTPYQMTATFAFAEGATAVNYVLPEPLTATLIINKATYNMEGIAFSNDTLTYDGEEHSLAVTGTLPQGVSVSYSVENVTDAGTYTVVASFTGNENYNAISDMTATLTINKAEISTSGLVFENASKAYNEAAQSLEISNFNTVSDLLTVSYTNATNVGVHTITATFAFVNEDDAKNYILPAPLTATLTITKGTPVVNPVYANGPYYVGTAIPTISLTEGDTAGTISWDLSYTILVNENSYSWTFVPTDEDNYNGATGTVNLTGIDKVVESISIETAPSKLSYKAFEELDKTGLVVKATFNDSSVLTLTDSDYVLVYETEGADSFRFGDTKVKVTYGGKETNIEEIVVSKITLDGVTYENAQVDYDGESHNIAITGTLPSWLTVAYAEAQTNANESGYDMTATFSFANDATADNYVLPEVMHATLKIMKINYDMSSVTFEDAAYDYDGQAHTLVIGGNLPTGVTPSYTTNELTNAGSVAVTVSFTGDANHNAIESMEATLTINPLTFDKIGLELAGEASVTYDGNEHTYTLSVPVEKEMPSWLAYTITAATNAGTHTITLTFTVKEGLLASNYVLPTEGLSKELVINKATYDMTGVTFTNKSVQYNGSEQELLVVGDLPEGVTVVYTNNKLTNVGSTDATAEFTGDSTNYEAIADMTATLTITKRTFDTSVLSFENDDLEVEYDGQAHTLVLQNPELIPNWLTYSMNSEIDADVYYIIVEFALAEGQSLDNNEVPEDLEGLLTINAKSGADFTVEYTNLYEVSSREFTAINPEVVVKDGATTLVLDTDYTVDYTNNTAIATGTEATGMITIVFKGNYKDMVNKQFTIKLDNATKVDEDVVSFSTNYSSVDSDTIAVLPLTLADGSTVQYTNLPTGMNIDAEGNLSVTKTSEVQNVKVIALISIGEGDIQEVRYVEITIIVHASQVFEDTDVNVIIENADEQIADVFVDEVETTETANYTVQTGEEVKAAYDINLLDAEAELIHNPNKPVKVKLPIPANVNFEDVVIYHRSDEGVMTLVTGLTQEGNHIVFNAREFSKYVIVEKLTYTVIFMDGETEVSTVSGKYGQNITLPTAPTKAETEQYTYTFAGWDGNEDDEVDTISTYVSDMIYEAIFTSTTKQYTLSYNSNGGSGEMTGSTVDYNTNAQVVENTFTYEGKTFVKWNTLSDGTGTDYEPEALIPLTSNVTLYAVWEDAVTENKIVFDFSSINGTGSAASTADGIKGCSTNQLLISSIEMSKVFNDAGKIKLGAASDKGSLTINLTQKVNSIKITCCNYGSDSTNIYVSPMDFDPNNADKNNNIGKLALTAASTEYIVNFTTATNKIIIESRVATKNRFYISNIELTLAPELPKLTTPTISISNNLVSWSEVEGATGYNVYADNELLTTTPITELSYNLLGLEVGEYTIKVEAVGNQTTTDNSLLAETSYNRELLDSDRVELDKNELTLPETVTENITLRSVGTNGTTITWAETSDANNVCEISNGIATITRPSDADAAIVLTATIELNGATDTKEFTITVTKQLLTVTLSFDSNEGSSVDAITQEQGSELTMPSDPIREGYTFDGWYTSNEYSEEFDSDTMPLTSITVFAKWLLNHTVTFNANGASNTMAPQIIAEGKSANLNANTLTKEGYAFDGWATTSNGEVVYADKASYIMENTDVELFAIWVQAEMKYVLVTSVSELSEGDTIIFVHKNNTSAKNAVNGSLDGSILLSSYKADETVIIENNICTAPNYYALTLGTEENYWTFLNSDGVALGSTAAKKLAFGSGTMTWTISITSTGVATIANTTEENGNLQYNSESPRFTTYTSNMQAISIYKLTAVATGA